MSSISSDISSHCPLELDEDSYGPYLSIPWDTKKHVPQVDPEVGVFKRKGKKKDDNNPNNGLPKGNETNDLVDSLIKKVEE